MLFGMPSLHPFTFLGNVFAYLLHIKSHKLMAILWAHIDAIGCIGLSYLFSLIFSHTDTTDSAVTGLGVATALLGVALAVCLVVMLALLMCMRRQRTYQLKGVFFRS